MADPAELPSRSRRRGTRWRVRAEDVLARALIAIGGIGTIVAVIGVFVFLAVEVLPLFRSASFEPSQVATPPNAQVLHAAVDEYRLMGWRLTEDGELTIFRLDTGETLESRPLISSGKIEAVSFDAGLKMGALGMADGTVSLVNIAFKTDFPTEDSLSPEVLNILREGAEERTTAVMGDALVQRTRQGQYRRQRLVAELGPGMKLPEAPVRQVDLTSQSNGVGLVALAGDGEDMALYAATLTEKEDFFTGETAIALTAPKPLPFEGVHNAQPVFLGFAALGSDVYVIFENGWLERIRTIGTEPFIAEKGRLGELTDTITAVTFVQGRHTLVWSDAAGHLRGGFLVQQGKAGGTGLLDRQVDPAAQLRFAIAKHLDTQGQVATSLNASTRSRLVLAGFEDGSIRLYNVTNEGLLGSAQGPGGATIRKIVFAPKEDGLWMLSDAGTASAALDPMHPEVTFKSLFTRVWYEGYAAPGHTWQSSGLGGFEPKLGLMPLIFGTIKATIYAMMFGVPIALFAAVFSSEFLDRRAKAVIKPCIELMASLPSVVLGFLAALVFAPFVERVIAPVLLSLVTLPAAFLLAAYLWQLLPNRWAVRLGGKRLLFMMLPLVGGLLAAAMVGPWVESLLFGGDIKAWTAWGPEINDPSQQRYASAIGGWMFLLLPVVAIGMAVLVNRTVTARMRRTKLPLARSRLAIFDFAKFLAAAFVTLAVAWLAGWLLNSAGLDPRGDLIAWGINYSPVDTYAQRNSLVVGFIMGFAIIPLIYTISDDALSAVPEHLRSASLGAGATPWQTAMRIVIPTAMSGLFSAMMIGLGRAVGETMIVLMASGGTPVLDMNIFEGFRTLSANIAVELPEAPRGSTHYRTLFLAALVLFVMTFLINTVAELVRQRYRKRAYQL